MVSNKIYEQCCKKIYFVIPTNQSENKTMRTNNSLWWPQQLHTVYFCSKLKGCQNPISFLNYTCIWMIHFFTAVT